MTVTDCGCTAGMQGSALTIEGSCPETSARVESSKPSQRARHAPSPLRRSTIEPDSDATVFKQFRLKKHPSFISNR